MITGDFVWTTMTDGQTDYLTLCTQDKNHGNFVKGSVFDKFARFFSSTYYCSFRYLKVNFLRVLMSDISADWP